jgi:hypothetical protein
MALNQSRYQVAADAEWRWRPDATKPLLQFAGRGSDDRDDLLAWFLVKPAPRGAWIQITPVETATADPPRRRPRLKVNWNTQLRRRRREDVRAIADLTRRLRQPERPPPALPPLPVRADRGFVVTIDDQLVGSAGVTGHGPLTVSVFLVRKGRRVALSLTVNGGERIDDMTWRFRHWRWGRLQPLEIGQRVRIAVGRPERLDLGTVGRIHQFSHKTKAEMREELAELRRKVKADRYTTRGRERAAEDAKRPPPRTYPRTPIRDG